MYCFFTNNIPPSISGVGLNTIYHINELNRNGIKNIHFYIPWLEEKKQIKYFGFNFTQSEQINLLINKYKLSKDIKIHFYDAEFYVISLSGSGLLPINKIENICPKNSILIFEDPNLYLSNCKNFNKYHFTLIISILHTNYYHYIYHNYNLINDELVSKTLSLYLGLERNFLSFLNGSTYSTKNITRSFIDTLKYTTEVSDITIAISPSVIEPFKKKELTNISIINMIGVPYRFFSYKPLEYNESNIFYIGKPIINKNIHILLKLMSNKTLHMFGTEPSKNIKLIIKYYNVNFVYHGYWNQTEAELLNYKIFLNCSISEGICTTNIEMLCLHKFLILPSHISNDIFKDFENVYFYKNINQVPDILALLNNKQPIKLSKKKLYKKFSYNKIGEELVKIIKSIKRNTK